CAPVGRQWCSPTSRAGSRRASDGPARPLRRAHPTEPVIPEEDPGIRPGGGLRRKPVRIASLSTEDTRKERAMPARRTDERAIDRSVGESAAISVRGLSKRFGRIEAVSDLSFEVRPGAVTGFLGPNGAGKTTTLPMVLG